MTTKQKKKPKVAPLLITIPAEDLNEGDYVEGEGIVEMLFIRQLVVYLIDGDPHIVNRNTKLQVRLEDDGL